MGNSFLLLIFVGLFHLNVGEPYTPQIQGLDLTLKVNEDLPNHLCGRALSSLEVTLIRVKNV